MLTRAFKWYFTTKRRIDTNQCAPDANLPPEEDSKYHGETDVAKSDRRVQSSFDLY
jgi:hypothetical protein